MTTDPIDTTALAVHEAPPTPPDITLFGTADPVTVVAKATAIADALADVIKQKGLAISLGGPQARKHVVFEGWTLLGSMLGVFPIVVWSRPLADASGWEACVEARTRSGDIVGAAEAMCTRRERNWANRDDYALRSMAITRASGKALRMPLGFVMTLAGYEATPAEEMPHETSAEPSAARSGSDGASVEAGKAPSGAARCPEGHPIQQRTLKDGTRSWLQCNGKNPDGSYHNWKPSDAAPRGEPEPATEIQPMADNLPELLHRVAGEVVGVSGTPQHPEVTIENAGKRLGFSIDLRSVPPDLVPTADHLSHHIEARVAKLPSGGYEIREVVTLAPPQPAGEPAQGRLGA